MIHKKDIKETKVLRPKCMFPEYTYPDRVIILNTVIPTSKQLYFSIPLVRDQGYTLREWDKAIWEIDVVGKLTFGKHAFEIKTWT